MKKIPLTKGLFALVDDEDYEYLMQWKWCASLESRGTKFYAVRNPKLGKIRMHHAVLRTTPDKIRLQYGKEFVVDHVNHDSLDNRKENLEIITQEENMRRSKGWKKKKTEPFL